MSISFRPAGQTDEPFLLRVYGSTRAAELSVLPWTPAQVEAFLKMQLAAQLTHYKGEYPDASHDIILFNDQPVGRLYVARLEKEIRIVDIALLTEARGRGIGTSIIKDLMDEAAREGKPLSIYVENFSPSLHLFERLGFSKAGEQNFYLLMQWQPNS
jgi:ribosomal protein S18 acetylase RimI-like enzyme